MICSSCKNIYDGLDFCPLCKTPKTVEAVENDTTENKDQLQYLVDYYSKKYYTIALEHSKKRQIYYAIRNLNKSLFFESNNKDTRNLLGLCYIETGRIGEASKEFLLSCFIEGKENIADEYLEKIEKAISETENYDLSIESYNEALELMKNKKISLAILKLRSAVSYNKKFVDAHLLLALCCIMRNMYDEAKININEVLKIDVENPMALKYLSEIKLKENGKEGNKENVVTKESKEKIENKNRQPINNNKIVYEEVVEKSNYALVYIIIAFLVGCILTYIFTKNYFDSNVTDDVNTIKTLNTLRDSNENFRVEIDEKNDEIEALEESYKKLQNDYEELEKAIPYQNDLTLLINALNLFNNNENVLAANVLLSVNKENLTPEDIEVYDKIKEGSFQIASEHFLEAGFSESENENIEKSIENFEKSILLNNEIDASDITIVDAYYWLGKLYTETGNVNKALKNYNYILENFSEYSLINEIQESVIELEKLQ